MKFLAKNLISCILWPKRRHFLAPKHPVPSTPTSGLRKQLRLRYIGVAVKIVSVVGVLVNKFPDNDNEREKKEKDSYGNEVSRLARPLPVEYLLVDVPASTPVTPNYTFNTDPSKQPFPVENRLIDGDIQDFNALNHYLSQFGPGEFFTAINDFHLLIYIATMDMLPMKEYMGPLLQALRNKDAAAAEEWSRSEHWATIEQLIAASSPPPSRPGSVASGSVNAASSSSTGGGAKWTCPHCTFLNTSEMNNCEMCSLPRSTPH